MKAFVLAPNEDWIVDRFVKEWYVDNSDISTKNIQEADVIWLMADWCFNQVPLALLQKKKVLTTVHHIVPEKFNINEFNMKDSFTDAYHVPNEITARQVSFHTKKPVHVIPYWANQRIFKIDSQSKQDLRAKHNLPLDSFLIGSFQRDTEGHDLKSPKLEKGPDLLADFAIKKHVEWKQHNGPHEPHVVLGGWRRQYVINRLTAAGVPFTYFEKPAHDIINELYQTLDLYPVTSRCEGGPQSLIECGLLGMPVVSRRVGMASAVLPASAISDDVSIATPAIPNVHNLKLPMGYEFYRKLLVSL